MNKQLKQFFGAGYFQIKCQKDRWGKKHLPSSKKLGHKSTHVLGKLGSKAVDVVTSKAAKYLVGSAETALL